MNYSHQIFSMFTLYIVSFILLIRTGVNYCVWSCHPLYAQVCINDKLDIKKNRVGLQNKTEVYKKKSLDIYTIIVLLFI